MERGGNSNSQPDDTTVPRSDDGNSYMPVGNLMRIMKRILPDEVKVGEDAKEAIQELITFITREANQICHRDSRNKLTPTDVLSAMAALGFHNYLQPLLLFMNKHHHHLTAPVIVPQENQMPILPPPTPTPTPTVVNYSQMGDCFSGGGQGSSTVGSYVPSPPPMLDISQIRDYLTAPHVEFDPFN